MQEDIFKKATMFLGRRRDWFIAGAIAGLWILYEAKQRKSADPMTQQEVEQWNEHVKKTEEQKKKNQ
jgi:hypothetical protein